MSIPAGTRLGPYEILAMLGAGGMGEVYRARDSRLGRDVAVKVLPEEFFEGEERRMRFEREAKLLASLNHPNVAAVHSFEEIPSSSPAPSPSRHILVMELLEGETLRARLAHGPLPVRKAVDFGAQIARGLAAAHGRGIVHRDLKPENLFVTKDGRIKILDFGLAKLRAPAADATEAPTESALTESGVVMGTAGYMSPEQVRGEPLDARSDVFSFGAVLHEMVSGIRVFRRASSAETMAAILHEEPPALSAKSPGVPPALERIVAHCLEKDPDGRFQSARDLAFDLEALGGSSAAERALSAAPGARRPSRRALAAAVVATAVACTGLTALLLRRAPARTLSFRQITFRRGTLSSARFGSDGKTVLYSAAWEGGPYEIHVARTDGPDSRPLGLTKAHVLSVSGAGEAAVLLHAEQRSGGNAWVIRGTLARAAETGGVPREILENVESADYAPGGKDFVIVRTSNGRRRLEYPAGKVLDETVGWYGGPRFSPRGDLIAFIDHPSDGDDGGAVATLDLSGKKKVLTPTFESAAGLAWSPDGSEIWFTAAEGGASRALRAVTPAGRARVLFSGTGNVTLRDVARDGRALLTHDITHFGFAARGPDDAKERDLSWFDASDFAAISADGRTALFSEVGVGGGPGYSVYLRRTDGSPAVRLGEGGAMSLSPDGRRALATLTPARGERVVIHPTGPGETKTFSWPGLRAWDAAWLPDGRRFLVTAAAAGHGVRVYLADVDGGEPKPLTPEGYGMPVRAGPVDGRRFLVLAPDGKILVQALEGGEAVPVPGIGPDDSVPGPSGRDGWILVRRGRGLPVRLDRLELATGRSEAFAEIVPADAAGIVSLGTVAVARDGRSYGYAYARVLTDLFVVEGLK